MGGVPWGSSGWKGVQASPAAYPGWEQPGFDDSAWPEVTLPIGGGVGECPLFVEHPPNTSWPVNTDFLLRRRIIGSHYTVTFAVDNHAWVYVDGVLVAEGDNEPEPFCPTRTDHPPASLVLTQGEHVVAIRANDRGGESYFDCQVDVLGLVRRPAVGRVGFAFGGSAGVNPPATVTSPNATYSTFVPNYAYDGSVTTYWQSVGGSTTSERSLEMTFTETQTLRQVDIVFYDTAHMFLDYVIETWDGSAWTTQQTVAGNSLPAPSWSPSSPVAGVSKLRVRATRWNSTNPSSYGPAIREVSVLATE